MYVTMVSAARVPFMSIHLLSLTKEVVLHTILHLTNSKPFTKA